MRIRTIKPEFWTHPVLGKLDDGARLLAIGLLNLADDEGYFLAHPTLVRNALRAFDEDSTKTRRALEALSKVGWIDVREHSEQGQIGKVVNFAKHQRIDRPTLSKLSTYFDSTNARRGLDEPSLLEGKGKEQGKEQGKDQGMASPWLVKFGLELPESLRTQPCLDAVNLWLTHKTEIRDPYKATGLRMAMAKWANEFTPAEFPGMVEESIARGWKGIFRTKEQGQINGKPQPAKPTWVLIKELEAQIDVHPANPNALKSRVYDPEWTGPQKDADKADYKALRVRLEALQQGQTEFANEP